MLLTFLKAFFLIAPDIWNEIKRGKIKGESQVEVLNALLRAHEKRVRAALAARQEAVKEAADPNDRSNR